MLLLAMACVDEPRPGIQVGAEGTPPGPPPPGGVEIWSAGGTTGARPLLLDAAGTCDPVAAGVADLDEDGVLDIALACRGAAFRGAPSVEDDPDRYHVLLWSGAEAARGNAVVIGESRFAPTGPGLAVVPDLDGDGVAELSVGPEDAPGGVRGQWALVASGRGLVSGSEERWALVGEYPFYPAEPPAVAAGDYDGDGVSDLAIAGRPSGSQDDNRVYVVSGATVPGEPRVDDAPLRLWTRPFAAGWLSRVVPVGDIDADGVPDLAVPFDGSGTVPLLLGADDDGAMSPFPAITTMDLGPGGTLAVAALGDLDGDGRAEIAISARRSASSHDEETRVAVIPGADLPTNSGLSFDGYVIEEGPGSFSDLLACDVDGDGAADLLTPRGWYAGADLLSAPVLAPLPFADTIRVVKGVCAGDLDGDGRADVIVPTRYPSP